MSLDSTPPPKNGTEHVLETCAAEDIRRAIDLVATIRARVVRVELYGVLLHRKDPAGPTLPEVRAAQIDTLTEQVEMIEKVCSTLTRGTPLPGVDPEICTWINQVATRDRATLADIIALAPLSRAVLCAAKDDGRGQGYALTAYGEAARGSFFGAVTRFCDALWADLNAFQSAQLEKANAAATLLGNRLIRLEYIGKHVKLVSLNASVEAARAGDVGKGQMIIAHEFKTLAEEIQSLATQARQDMAIIS